MEEAVLIRKYGMLRYLISKHFLSKPLDQILQDARVTGTFKLRALGRLKIFTKAIEKVFPKHSEYYPNMGTKFEFIQADLTATNSTMYSNSYT